MKLKVNLKRFLSVLALVSFLSVPLFSESSYTITESQLEELKGFKTEYQTLWMDYQNLEKEYQKTQEDLQTQTENLTKQTEDLTQQIKDLEALSKKSKRQSTIIGISVGCVSFTIGAAAGIIIYSLTK